jgi:hypothetical protein
MSQHETPREHLDATRQAVAAAHEHHTIRALQSVEWERRGLLQRLMRGGRRAGLRLAPDLARGAAPRSEYGRDAA